MEKNNIEFDTLKLYVKRSKLEEIIEYYKSFKWEIVSQEDNAQYEDIIDLTFIRSHNLENKDELQLIQVYMEERLNSIGRLEKIRILRQHLLVFVGELFALLCLCWDYIYVSG